MDEDIFPELCVMNAKKTYSKPFKKLLQTPQSNSVSKTSKPMENGFEFGEPLTTKDAVEYLLNGKLKKAVCRYCLKVPPVLSELDMIMQIAGTGTMYKVTIRQMIACFYPYKANEDQNFPDKICDQCLDKAINAYLFTQQCEQAERALLNCLDDMYEKLEKLDPIDRPKKRGRQKLNPNHNILYAEHKKVIDYAEPIRNIINIQAESLTQEPDWNDLECKKCWQVLPNIESLLNHEKIHPKHMWYHCRLCGKSFIKHNQLKKHYNRVHVQGKDNGCEVDKNFKCNLCGNITKDYILHLQHIEKHKFKTVMKHLIEKKTDQLCMVCLNKSTDLVELDKMVCIHGGYPELVGDKTLYTVLASTLPDHKSYKYQELYVPHKANIMTITKRKSKDKNRQNLLKAAKNIQVKYDLSPPTIVFKDRFKTNDFYYYVFCDPQIHDDINNIIDTNNMDTARIVEITDEELKNLHNIVTVGEGKNEISEPGHSNPAVKNIHGDQLTVNVIENRASDIKILTNESEPTDLTKYCNKNDKIITNYKDCELSLLGRSNVDVKNFADDLRTMDLIQSDCSCEKSLPDNIQPTEDKILNDEGPMDFINSNQSFQMFNFCNPILLEVDKSNEHSSSIFNYTFNIDMAYKFNFSYPHNDWPMDQEKPNYKQINENKEEYEINYKSYHSLIFNKTLWNCDPLKDVGVAENTDSKKRGCKLCWVFKHLNKCEFCNAPNILLKISNTADQNGQKNYVADHLFKKNIETNTKKTTNSNEIHKTSAEFEKDTTEDKVAKIWQCNVCLTHNNKNRFTCYCCESKKYIENGNCKVIFGNETFFDPTLQKEEKNIEKVLLNIGTTPSLIVEEATMTIQNVNLEVINEIHMTNNKDTEDMDTETEPVNYFLGTKISTQNEIEMDVEETPYTPNIIENFSIAPINLLTSASLPYFGTDIQFTIGSNPVQQGKGARNIKRVLRKMPKAFHK